MRLSVTLTKNVHITFFQLFMLLIFPAMIFADGSESHNNDSKFFKSYYFPGVEELDRNEMRITALGTGLPVTRKGQAASS